MRIRSWQKKMGNISFEEAAKLLFMDVETLKVRQRFKNDCQKLTAIMNYQEIMQQPSIDMAAKIMRKHYRKVKGDHWE